MVVAGGGGRWRWQVEERTAHVHIHVHVHCGTHKHKAQAHPRTREPPLLFTHSKTVRRTQAGGRTLVAAEEIGNSAKP